jgi:hypothetical protein
MDRTVINLVSILVGGAGLFTVLTGFNVPELNMSFFGANPYAVKRDAIESTMKWMFAVVALIGLFLQLCAEIWGANLPDRSHDSNYYIILCVGGLVVVGIMLWVLTGVGNRIAKWQWQPTVIELQREIFERTKFVAEHDGWTPDHWETREAITAAGDSERYKANNMKTANEHLGQIEKLLEVESRGDLRQRVITLQPMFPK